MAIATSLVASIITAIFRGYSDVIPNALFCTYSDPWTLRRISTRRPSTASAWTLLHSHSGRVHPRERAHARGTGHLRPASLAGPFAPRSTRARVSGPLFRFTAPLFVVGVMFNLSGSGDTVVLSAFHPSEVGAYTATLTLARLMAVGIGSASFIFLPFRRPGFFARGTPARSK